MSWTSDRLQNVATEALQGAKLVVVANREPFSHIFRDGEICCEQPASITKARIATRAVETNFIVPPD